MTEFLTQLKDNIFFVVACIVIIAAIALGAKLIERFLPQMRKVSKARRVCIVAICSAIATLLYIMDFTVLFLAPAFYKLDFSELPVLLCGFYLGPSATVACEAVKILLKLILEGTSTAFVGDFANFVVGCSLALPATAIYHIKRKRSTAFAGLAAGTLILTVFGSAFNAVYLLPKFSELYGTPMEDIIAMGTAINSNIHSVSTFVLLTVAPLNLIKGCTVSILTLLLYKKVARPLFDK